MNTAQPWLKAVDNRPPPRGAHENLKTSCCLPKSIVLKRASRGCSSSNFLPLMTGNSCHYPPGEKMSGGISQIWASQASFTHIQPSGSSHCALPQSQEEGTAPQPTTSPLVAFKAKCLATGPVTRTLQKRLPHTSAPFQVAFQK